MTECLRPVSARWNSLLARCPRRGHHVAHEPRAVLQGRRAGRWSPSPSWSGCGAA